MNRSGPGSDTLNDRNAVETNAPSRIWDERIALERTARVTSTYPFAGRSLSVPAAFPRDSSSKLSPSGLSTDLGSGRGTHCSGGEYYTERGEFDEWPRREYTTLLSLDSLEVSRIEACQAVLPGEADEGSIQSSLGFACGGAHGDSVLDARRYGLPIPEITRQP